MTRASSPIAFRLVSVVVLLMTLGSLASVTSSNIAVASPTTPTCFSSQLKMTADQGGGAYSAAGNQGVAFIFTNIGNTPCSLKGYPKFQFEPSSFRRRLIKITHGGGGIFASVSPRLVVLKPNAAASFGIDYGDAYNQSPDYNHATCITQSASAWLGVQARPYPVAFVAPVRINFCFADFKFRVTPVELGRIPVLTSAG